MCYLNNYEELRSEILMYTPRTVAPDWLVIFFITHTIISQFKKYKFQIAPTTPFVYPSVTHAEGDTFL